LEDENRVRIACRDEAEHQLVKRVAETRSAPGVRVLRDEFHTIKVENVKRIAILDERRDIRTGATEAPGKEKDTMVAKIWWLSKKDITENFTY
jgi:hypothetical protein